MTLSVVVVGECFEINWPKFVILQGFKNPDKAESRPDAGPSAYAPAPAPADATQERESAPSAPEPPAAPRHPRRVLIDKPEHFPDEAKERLRAWAERKGFDRAALNAGLELFREWAPLKPPYRRTIEQWEGAFKKILRESMADGRVGKLETKPRPAYRRDGSGQVLVPNEWRGLAG